jgi:DNA polymerase III subunit delta'
MTTSHKKQWDFLKNKFESDQLSHAYLFTGAKGLGKKDFAEKFAELIGCKFPDLKIVSEENKKDSLFGDGGEIKISQIRDVQNFLSYKSYNGSYKVVIIDEAEKMNQEAQSCFLKTLEEPKGQTLLILVASKPDMLLPTIFSRCQTIKFLGKPVLSAEKISEENKILQEFLQAAGGELSEKFKYAKSLDFQEQDLNRILNPFEKYLRYLLLKKIGVEEKSYFSKIPSVLENYPVSKIKQIIKMNAEILNKMLFTNANPRLALEILLMEI